MLIFCLCFLAGDTLSEGCGSNLSLVFKALQQYLYLSCVCTIQWLILDLNGGLPCSSALKAIDLLLTVRSISESPWISHFFPLILPGLDSKSAWNPDVCNGYGKKSPKRNHWFKEWERGLLCVIESGGNLIFPLSPRPHHRQSPQKWQLGGYLKPWGGKPLVMKVIVVPRA